MTPEQIAAVFRAEYGRSVAVLIRTLGDIDLAEDAVADAFAAALRRWPQDGPPPSPAGWIITTARRRAIDQLRRESARAGKYAEAALVHAPPDDTEESAVPDERLRLMFTCCHPALNRPAQVALTLRLLGGLTTPDIARAFLVRESTMAQRLARAKAKIRDARIPYRVPGAADLPERLDSVLATLFLIFNEGYVASSGPELLRADLCAEAVRLTRALVESMPGEPEAAGLLALMLLTHARRDARTDATGAFVRLADQDRGRWDAALVAEGRAIVRACLRHNRPGRYQLLAAINAVHTDPVTDWRQILALYDRLARLDPNPVVALHRSVAVAEIDGPAAALSLVDGLDLTEHYLFHAVRADLLARLGRTDEAKRSFDTAARLTANQRERDYLATRSAALTRR
ncbi:RNA polymerase sigma factor [Nocardia africana]|uniref:Sigma-K factor n=1 Tax=Nocardia africana TaxID=134964 RepID=A0A378WSQ5_9NOCA|nr:sigma-70 family RNA polymerase sigma factor [Nocardia africana]MCC3314363.1 sigma-70 family RNA polymerase sigma factor [Nocardia africana]SUA43373.1 Sigma-K factor [Nocardia africana]